MSAPPNVMLIVADTARAGDAYACDPEIMPTLRSLSDKGTQFAQAFSTAPWTLPAHAGLFTGTYSSHHGAHGKHPYLDDQCTTVAEAFSAAGYETWAASNNTWISKEFGFDRGFDTFWRGWQLIQSTNDVGSAFHESGTLARLKAACQKIGSGNPVINSLNASYAEFQRSRGNYGGRRTTDRIQQWLRERDRSTPFFGFVNYLEPHIEYTPPKDAADPFLPEGATYQEARRVRQDPRAFDVDAYELSSHEIALLKALYCGELAFVDEQIRRIREALEATDVWEDTILVVVGDHGENIGEHGFLGHQYNIYDTLLHVPLVITGGPFDGRGAIHELVQLTDIAPSLLDATGIDAPPLREQTQGVSFHPTNDEIREFVIAEYLGPQPPVATLAERFGPLPDHVHAFDRGLEAIRTHEEKLIRGSDGHREYYRIDRDPSEQDERSALVPERVSKLVEQLDSWQSTFESKTDTGDVDISQSTRDQLAQLGYM